MTLPGSEFVNELGVRCKGFAQSESPNSKLRSRSGNGSHRDTEMNREDTERNSEVHGGKRNNSKPRTCPSKSAAADEVGRTRKVTEADLMKKKRFKCEWHAKHMRREEAATSHGRTQKSTPRLRSGQAEGSGVVARLFL